MNIKRPLLAAGGTLEVRVGYGTDEKSPRPSLGEVILMPINGSRVYLGHEPCGGIFNVYKVEKGYKLSCSRCPGVEMLEKNSEKIARLLGLQGVPFEGLTPEWPFPSPVAV
ncbi:hypothetical protein KW797_00685 [Candidatus Parcubacteria bacterium]|nr:hypothetical protein [Candidatus Parcubacteria bacterium]